MRNIIDPIRPDFKYADLIEKAGGFIREKFGDKLDDEGKPAWFHSVNVFEILENVPADLNLLTAALLHDTIEDTDTTYEELVKEFNQDIADLVMEVTHEGNKDDHGYYFPRLHTQRGIILKFADRLSNISRMGSWDDKRKEQYLKRSKFWKSE